MFRNIVIATDGSALSDKVLPSAAALAKALAAKITGVHVYPASLPVFSGEMAWVDERLRDRLRESALEDGKRYLDRVEAAARSAGVPFERVPVESDEVWKGIIETAREKGGDLIVMAAHGRRGVAALVLGSETQKVLTHSKIPVLVYR